MLGSLLFLGHSNSTSQDGGRGMEPSDVQEVVITANCNEHSFSFPIGLLSWSSLSHRADLFTY